MVSWFALVPHSASLTDLLREELKIVFYVFGVESQESESLCFGLGFWCEYLFGFFNSFEC